MEIETINNRIAEIEEKMNDPDLCLGTAMTMSRVTGFWRSIEFWNTGKKAEWAERVPYRFIINMTS